MEIIEFLVNTILELHKRHTTENFKGIEILKKETVLLLTKVGSLEKCKR